MNKDDYTYKEIMSQPASWKKAYEDIIIENSGPDLSLISKGIRVIFFGCGTSYNLAQSASCFHNSLLPDHSMALPSSELLVNPDCYINQANQYLIIGFSRSGETTETVEVFKKLKNRANLDSIALSCKPGSSIIDLSHQHFICGQAVEKSVVMTVSFSVMLLAYGLMLAKYLDKKDIISDFKLLISYMEKNMGNFSSWVLDYVEKHNFNSYFVLGSGFNYGLSLEADLKMKEMAQVLSSAYHFYEFNHGPKSLVDSSSLCLILTLNKNMPKQEKVIDQLLQLNGKVLIVGGHIEKKHPNLYIILHDLDTVSNMVESFINIPIFQLLAYAKTKAKNLNPDKPRNLDYTLKL